MWKISSGNVPPTYLKIIHDLEVRMSLHDVLVSKYLIHPASAKSSSYAHSPFLQVE